MSGSHKQEWKSRKEIPNPQIRDAADQYDRARRILLDQPPGSGVLLPLMNTAAVAIELYLKCLSSEVVHVPDKGSLGGYLVYAEPVAKGSRGHRLVGLFDKIPDDVRRDLANAFEDRNQSCSKCLRDTLGEFEGSFSATRYPFEPGNTLDQKRRDGDLRRLMSVSDFLGMFTLNMKPRENIHWE